MENNNFNLSENELEALVREGLKYGGSWCDLYFENTTYHDLLLRDSEVSSGGFNVDYGCGIRVLDGEKTGYAYSETTDFPSLVGAAEAAASIACGGRAISPVRICGRPDAPRVYSMDKDWRESLPSEFIPFLRRLDSRIRAKDSRVIKVIAMLSYSVSEIMMYNSLGQFCSDTRPLGSISVTAVFKQGEAIEKNSVSKSLRAGSELLSKETEDFLVQKAVSGVDALFEARRPKGGQMSVVMAAGASGILLHEAMGHSFEADFNRKGQSIFSDKMGKRICPEGINIVDDGTIPQNRGSMRFDDEGVPSQKTYMVRDGILSSYLHDRISAAYYKVPPTGNGRRESFRYNPIPRMRATYMENGSDGTLQDLISSVRKGVYVDQFTGGQVKIGEGDFTFYVKSGYVIENGRLTSPIKDVNIIGNGPQALSDIRAVAGDLKIDNGTWTCGKEQSVAVSCGIPSVLIGKLTVGGGQ